MLTAWQQRFPEIFEKHHSVLREKTSIQETAANTLAFLESHALLDEKAISFVLESMPYDTNKLFYILQLMHEQGCLDKRTLARLCDINLYTFDQSLQTLSTELRLSNNLQRLLAADDPQTCASFIQNMHLGHVDQTTIDAFLNQEPALDALSQALILFDLAQKIYSPESLPVIRTLTTFFTNPLMQTMFTTRNRGFSDYEQSYEHLSHQDAAHLVQELSTLPNQEECFRIFFNLLTKRRAQPYSQKHPHISISQTIHDSLRSYFKHAIKTIHDAHDYDHVSEMIHTARNHGCNADMLASIRYHAAANIEAHDVYSQRTYDELMALVDAHLRQPYKKLPLFKQELLTAPGYQKKASAILRQTSLLLSSQSTTSSQGGFDADAEQSDQDMQATKRPRNSLL